MELTDLFDTFSLIHTNVIGFDARKLTIKLERTKWEVDAMVHGVPIFCH